MAKCKYIIEDGGKKLSFNSKADVASYFNRTKALTEAMQAKGDVDLDEYIAGLPNAKTKTEEGLQPQDGSKPTSEMQTPTESEIVELFEDGSDDVKEIARQYIAAQTDEKFSPIEQAIVDVGLKTSRGSFARFGDRNNLKKGKDKGVSGYFGEGGMSIDQIARSASEDLGMEVTPDDVVALMERFPEGLNRRSERASKLAEDYRRITGKNLTLTSAKAVLKEGAKPNKAAEDVLFEAIEGLDEDLLNEQGDIDLEKLLDKMESDEGYFTQFPLGLTKQQFNDAKENIKQQIENPSGESEVPIEPKRGSNEGSKQEEVEPKNKEKQDESELLDDGFKEKKSNGSSTVFEEIGASGEERSRAFSNRIYTGAAKEKTKQAAQLAGLVYDKKSQTLTEDNVRKFIDKVGLTEAVAALKEGLVQNDSAIILSGIALHEAETLILQAENQEQIDSTNQMQRDVISIINSRNLDAGRTIAANKYIYDKFDIGYNVEKRIEEYKAENFGQISEDVEARFREADKTIKELKKQLLEEQEKVRQKEVEESVASIKNDVERLESVESKKSYKQKSDDLAKKIRRLKISRPDVFSSVIPAAIVWDGAVEITASAIQAGGQLADAIKAGVDHIKKSDWYKSLDDKKKGEVEKSFNDSLNNLSDAPYMDSDNNVVVPYSTVKRLVSEGVTDPKQLVEAVKKELNNEDVTDRDVRDAITGYGREVSKTRSDISRDISAMKEALRLASRIEDAENNLLKAKDPKKASRLSDDVITMRAEFKNLTKDIPTKTDPQRAKNIIKQRIADYEQRISDMRTTGKEPKKRVTEKMIDDSELTSLRAKIQEAKDVYNNELLKVKEKNKSVQTKVFDSAVKTLGVARALQASLEYSYILIQGGALTFHRLFTKPKQLAKAFEMLGRATVSEKAAAEWESLIKSQPWYDEAMKAGLSLTNFNEGMNKQEEAFMRGYTDILWEQVLSAPSRLFSKELYEEVKEAANKINPFKATERGGSIYINSLRIARYLEGREKLIREGKTIETNPIAYKNVAGIINMYSGRASLGKKLDNSAQSLSLVFYSARNWASVIRQVTPLGLVGFINKTERSGGKIKVSAAQKIAAQNFIASVGFTTSMIYLVATYLNSDDDEETEVNTDPTSSDFGKIRIKDTRLDPWGGKLQMVVYMSRLLAGEYTSTSGITREIGGSLNGRDNLTYTGLTGNLVANKLSPIAGFGFNAASTSKKYGVKKDRFGNVYKLENEVQNLLTPMYWGGLGDIWKEHPTGTAGFTTFMGLMGMSSNLFGTQDEIIGKDAEWGIYKDIYDGKIDIPKDKVEEVSTKSVSLYKDILDDYKKSNPEKNIQSVEITKENISAAKVIATKELSEIKDNATKEEIDMLANKIAFRDKKQAILTKQEDDLIEVSKNAAIEKYYLDKGEEVPKGFAGSIKAYENKKSDLQSKIESNK